MMKSLLLIGFLFLGISTTLFAQTDTLDMSSEKERRAILEEMEDLRKLDEGATTKRKKPKKEGTNFKKRVRFFALKTAPFANTDLNFPSIILDAEYKLSRRIGITAGAGWIKGAGFYGTADDDQRGYRMQLSPRYYVPLDANWDLFLAPKIEFLRAWADKEVLVLQADNGFSRVQEITTIIRSTDFQAQVGWQYISQQGLLIETTIGGGIRYAGIFPTKEFEGVDLDSESSGFFRQNVQEMNFFLILRAEIRLGWAF